MPGRHIVDFRSGGARSGPHGVPKQINTFTTNNQNSSTNHPQPPRGVVLGRGLWGFVGVWGRFGGGLGLFWDPGGFQYRDPFGLTGLFEHRSISHKLVASRKLERKTKQAGCPRQGLVCSYLGLDVASPGQYVRTTARKKVCVYLGSSLGVFF